MPGHLRKPVPIFTYFISTSHRLIDDETSGVLACKHSVDSTGNKDYQAIRLMVSAANYLGLKFWVAVGFTHLCYVEAPSENTPTKAIELELQLDLANEEK